MREIKERYIIRYGKFGAYFFDLETQRQMELEQVAWLLNCMNQILTERGIDF